MVRRLSYSDKEAEAKPTSVSRVAFDTFSTTADLQARLDPCRLVEQVVDPDAPAHCDGLYYADLLTALNGELFPALLPQAQIIMLPARTRKTLPVAS